MVHGHHIGPMSHLERRIKRQYFPLVKRKYLLFTFHMNSVQKTGKKRRTCAITLPRCLGFFDTCHTFLHRRLSFQVRLKILWNPEGFIHPGSQNEIAQGNGTWEKASRCWILFKGQPLRWKIPAATIITLTVAKELPK